MYGERLLCMLSITLLLGDFLTLRVTKFKQLGCVVVAIKPWKLILTVGEHCQSHMKRARNTALQKFASNSIVILIFSVSDFLFITWRHRCAHSILLLCYATL